MRRRELLGMSLVPLLAKGAPSHTIFDRYFLPVLAGFLENSRRTSPGFAVCDFPDGTKKDGSLAGSGKTYDSVSRMMPAMAAWVAGGRQPATFRVAGEPVELTEVLRLTFQNAFDPEHPDYWLPSPPDQQQQRQVESSIVAWSLWLLGDSFLEKLTSAQRANAQAWLESCTRVPVRRNNWAWFTAVNQAARLALSAKWKEFSGDEGWMLEDLEALEKMALPRDGWYSDSLVAPVYDYYNFWVFASHFLYWNRMVGARYPDWARRFGRRLKSFLEKTPYFFGGNGSHVLFGRSLIYRWGVLTPLVLAYLENLWPHSPGLLRRIVARNLEYLWDLGAFDTERGKLRETLSVSGNREVCESYIDNGHPYWGMQAFALFLIPENDRFWTAREEPLPVERRDFQMRIEAPRMLLAGTARTGQVRWLHAVSGHHEPHYRDKYTKFSYSSHFPFNIIQSKDRCPWDGTLVFRNTKTGACAGRGGVSRSQLEADGTRIEWWAELDGLRFVITSRIVVFDEYEHRQHTIVSPPEAVDVGIEVLDGSYALGLEEGEMYEGGAARMEQYVRSPRSGHAIFTFSYSGYEEIQLVSFFEETKRSGVNIVYPNVVVSTLRAPVSSEQMTLESVHYASPTPYARGEIRQRAPKRMAALLKQARSV